MSFKEEFIDFIDRSLTPLHFVEVARSKLADAGYTEINEKIRNDTIPNKFFVVRDGRAIVAVNKVNFDCSVVVGAHIDSPVLQCVKGTNGIKIGSEYQSVFTYGGGTWMTWLDRDLRIAGRAVFQRDEKLYSKIIQSEEAVAVIPSLAVHLKSGISLKPGLTEENIQPIFKFNKDEDDKESTLDSIVAKLCGCSIDELVDYEVSLVPFQKASVTGITGEFIHSHRLDDLSSAITGLTAFLKVDSPATGTCVFAGYDNEEISSGSRCGARSDFLNSVLELAGADGPKLLHQSIFLSCDVCQGYNPNFGDLYNKDLKASLGEGLLWGFHPDMNFATTMPIFTFVEKVAKEINVPILPFGNKHFKLTGTTIGSHISSRHGILVIDMGIPLLAMHSIREMGSFTDIENLQKLIKACYDHIADVPAFKKSLE